MKYGGLDHVLQILHNSDNSFLTKNGIWVVSNLTRGRPQPEVNFVKQAVPVLCAILIKETDTEVLLETVRPLCYISERGEHSVIESFISAKVVAHLIRHLR